MANMYRKPSQEDDIAAAEDAVPTDSIDAGTMDIDADAPKKEPYSYDPSKDALARGLTGAAPALMGFLFGASPAMAENQIKEAQSYYKAGTPSKLVLTKGPDGQPIYSDAREAVNKEAYQKPATQKGPSGAGLQTVDLVSRDGTRATKALINKAANTMIEVGSNRVLSPDEWQPPVQTSEMKSTKDIYGSERIVPVKKFGEQQAQTLSSGIGAKYNIPEKEVAIGEQMAQKYLQDSKPIYESKVSLKGAINLLNAPDEDAITQLAGVFRTAKAIVNERLSDKELGAVTLPPGLLEGIQHKMETVLTNKNPQEKLRQLRGVLVELDSVNNLAINSMQDRYVNTYSAGDKNKAKFLADKIVAASDIHVPQQNVIKPLKKGVEFTKEQWSALTPAQRQREIDKIRSKKVKK